MKRGIRNRSNVKIRLDLTKRMVILSARASNSKIFLKNLEIIYCQQQSAKLFLFS